MAHRSLSLLILASALALVACSSSSTTGSGTSGAGSSGINTNPNSEQACKDTVEAFARAGERCGGNYKETYDGVLKAAANGDCKNVIGIRDETALRQTCIPFIKAQSCEDISAGKVDPSCSKQLQRTASFQPPLYPASTASELADDAL